MLFDKFVKWRKEDIFLPYTDIMLDDEDVLQMKKVKKEVFVKLHSISEYRLAMELANGKITKSEFDWAMKYWKFLMSYFCK